MWMVSTSNHGSPDMLMLVPQAFCAGTVVLGKLENEITVVMLLNLMIMSRGFTSLTPHFFSLTQRMYFMLSHHVTIYGLLHCCHNIF